MFNVVYCHTNHVNNKCYVGWTKIRKNVTPESAMLRRWRQHVKISKKCNFLFSGAIRKYGVDAWTHEILDVVSTVKVAKETEVLWIKERNSYAFDENGRGYNMTRGGDGGLKGRQIWNKGIKTGPNEKSIAFHRGRKRSEETKRKQSEAAMGPKNHNFGKLVWNSGKKIGSEHALKGVVTRRARKLAKELMSS